MKTLLREIPFTVRVNSADDNTFKLNEDGSYYNESKTLRVDVAVTEFEGINVLKQINTITNISDSDIVLSGFSSGVMKTVKGLIGVDRNRWQSEGQWSFFTAEQCGLVPATIHWWEKESFVISSVGSWSTATYYPLTMVIGEDGYTYFMELEGGHNWMLTHFTWGGINNTEYYLEGTSAHEENGGWVYTLKSGESYTTRPAIFGKVKGGFEETAGELLKYKRAVNLTTFKDNKIPVVFNDFMNCLWAEPSDKKLIPLIDAAAKVGCEYFCIDAGWFKCKNPPDSDWTTQLGDWLPDDNRFGEYGLQGILDYIKSKGMTPGVWFELETVYPKAEAYTIAEDCLLTRYGRPIKREFFNFLNQSVRSHLHSRIDDLYAMGVRFIKNDYNATTGIGCENGGFAPAEGLIRNYQAFISFIEEVHERHPDLLIENCGSGAGRADGETLKHFCVQSTSDQEFYFWYPSIIIGSAPQYIPEKMGIWSYPLPLCHDDREQTEFTEEWTRKFQSGEETVFNMVSGMCGVLYQSGRLDRMDEKNEKLIAEGIATYKKMREDIPYSHYIFPTGTCLIGEDCNASIGLETEDGSRAYLAVWRIGTEDGTVEIDVSKYGYTKAAPWYPQDAECELADGILRVKTPEKFSARMILLEK